MINPIARYPHLFRLEVPHKFLHPRRQPIRLDYRSIAPGSDGFRGFKPRAQFRAGLGSPPLRSARSLSGMRAPRGGDLHRARRAGTCGRVIKRARASSGSS